MYYRVRGVLVTGGERAGKNLFAKIIAEDRFVVAADSGIEYCLSAGIIPQVALGDMDSLEDPATLSKLGGVEVIVYPEDKDETDTELGLKLLHERGYDEVVLWGGGGGRLDHTLALRSLFERENPPVEWYTHRERVVLITSACRLEGFEGRSVSVFPVGPPPWRMKSVGLKWSLDGLIWGVGDCGISNLVEEEVCSVHALEGRLILIHEIGENDGR